MSRLCSASLSLLITIFILVSESEADWSYLSSDRQTYRQCWLPKCPGDVVASVGDNVVFRASTRPGRKLRWYRSTGNPMAGYPIYYGTVMDYRVYYYDALKDYDWIDERFDVIKSRPGQVDLLIRNVRLKDAGKYEAEDLDWNRRDSANLIVLDPDRSGLLCRNLSESTVQCNCSLTHRGRITPTISWRSADGHLTFLRSRSVKLNDTFTSTVTLSSSDTSRWPLKCQAEFRLKNSDVSTFRWTSEPLSFIRPSTAANNGSAEATDKEPCPFGRSGSNTSKGSDANGITRLTASLLREDGSSTSRRPSVTLAKCATFEFTCTSNKSTPISWYFTCATCPPRDRARRSLDIMPFGNVKRVDQWSNSVQQSTITVYNAMLNNSGTYTCVDRKDKREDANTVFAELTVIASPAQDSLLMCPTDAVANVGQNVILRAETQPERRLHWERNMGTAFRDVIVNDRYDVTNTRPGQTDLVIRNVSLDEAGEYRVRSSYIRKQPASTDVVVLNRNTSRAFCRRQSRSSVECHCTLNYHGRLRPTMRWLDADGRPMTFTSTEYITNSEGISLVTNSTWTWPHRCQARFDLKRCGQHFSTYYWTSEPVRLPSDKPSDETTTTTERPPRCSEGKWITVNNVKGSFGILRERVSLEECKQMCIDDPQCFSIDFNPRAHSYFYGHSHSRCSLYRTNDTSLQYDSNSKHYVLIRCAVVSPPPADIVFALDTSSSIGSENFRKMIHFVKSVVDRIDITAVRGSRIGLFTFTLSNDIRFHLNEYYNKADMLEAINATRYRWRTTYYRSALSCARDRMFQERYGDRADVPDYLVIITDGGTVDSEVVEKRKKYRLRLCVDTLLCVHG